MKQHCTEAIVADKKAEAIYTEIFGLHLYLVANVY